MFAFTTRKDLAAAVVAVQTYHRHNGADMKVNSVGTLLKKTPDDLQEMLSALLGDDLQVDAAFTVTPIEAEDDEEDEARPARGGRALHALTDIITVTVAKNPKRPGVDGKSPSGSYLRFDLLKTGMTVGDYLKAVEAEFGSARRARRTLRKAAKAGQVVISPAPSGVSTPVVAEAPVAQAA